MYSKTFVKDLLIIDELQKSDGENPKTARQILEEVNRRLVERFPKNFKPFENDEDLTKAVTATISRHVQDMNSTGLYDIKIHRDNKLGYYNATEGKNFPFTPAEFALIAIALYRTPSISTEETKILLKKFENLIGTTGETFSYAMVRKQIDQWNGIRRKTARSIFPIIAKLLKAIIKEQQITFNLYERSFKDSDEEIPLQKRINTRKKNEEIVITYKVSPYFLAWENDECYLIGHDPKNDTPEGHQLSHFKISLIENLKILDEVRPDREHICMDANVSPTVDVTIEFDEDFWETIKQLISEQKLTQRKVKFTQPTYDNDKWQTIMTVQDNDELYQWLLRYSDSVKVISPEKVREKLRLKFMPLRYTSLYARYSMESHPYYTDAATRNRLDEIENILLSDTRETTFKNFSLDRYMREHIYMDTNASPTVDVTIEFDKDFLETIFTQLTTKQRVTPSANGNGKWQTIMTVQDNDGLYQWLLRYSDKVKVISPKKIREKLRQRLNAALDNLKG